MAVLRYFVEQRELELASGTFKNRKGRLAAAAAVAAGAADDEGSARAPVSLCAVTLAGIVSMRMNLGNNY